MQLWAVGMFIIICVSLFSPCSHAKIPGHGGVAHSGVSVYFFASKTEVLLFTLLQFSFKGMKLGRADLPPKQEWGIKLGLFAIKERILEHHKTWRNDDYTEQCISSVYIVYRFCIDCIIYVSTQNFIVLEQCFPFTVTLRWLCLG